MNIDGFEQEPTLLRQGCFFLKTEYEDTDERNAQKKTFARLIYCNHGEMELSIEKQRIFLKSGELLFLSPETALAHNLENEDYRATEFLILPDFFQYAKGYGIQMNPYWNYAMGYFADILPKISYYHFQVQDHLLIQNYLQNLIWLQRENVQDASQMEMTLGMLFVQLFYQVSLRKYKRKEHEQFLMQKVLQYIDLHFQDGELTQLAKELQVDVYWLSREIKKRCGRNYTDLVQEKRLRHAAFLLNYTDMPVVEIGLFVGYDNLSYFHRIFQKRFGTTPRKYRVMQKMKDS